MTPVVSNNMAAPKQTETFAKRKNSLENKITQLSKDLINFPPDTRMTVMEKLVNAIDTDEKTAAAVKVIKLASQMLKVSSDTVKEEVKGLFQSDETLKSLIAINPFISPVPIFDKSSSITEIVKVPYTEKNLREIDLQLLIIYNEDDLLRDEILKCSGVLSTLSLALQTPHSTNDQTKEAATKELSNYARLLDKADKSKTALNNQKKIIENLIGELETVTIDFKKELEKRRKHFDTLFSVLVNRHGLLSDTIVTVKEVAGENTFATRAFGPKKNVEEPKASKEKPSIIVDEKEFSKFYRSIHEYFVEIREFVRLVEEHVNKVTGRRSTLTTLDPDFEEKKENAKKLVEEFQKYSERASIIYSYIESYSSCIETLKEKLTQKLNKDSKDLDTRRFNLKKNIDGLLVLCKQLDSQVDKDQKYTKDFKAFTI